MLDIYEHFQGVIHGHGQVVQLVQAHFIREDTLEEHWEKVSLPIDKAATGRSVNVLLPIGYHINLPSAILETLLGFSLQDILKDQAFAMIDHCLTQ